MCVMTTVTIAAVCAAMPVVVHSSLNKGEHARNGLLGYLKTGCVPLCESKNWERAKDADQQREIEVYAKYGPARFIRL